MENKGKLILIDEPSISYDQSVLQFVVFRMSDQGGRTRGRARGRARGQQQGQAVRRPGEDQGHGQRPPPGFQGHSEPMRAPQGARPPQVQPQQQVNE